MPIDVRIADDVKNIVNAANEKGITLGVCSGFRSLEHQQNLFNIELIKLTNQGLDESEAREKAKRSVAMPGRSEHHTGLAVDFYSHSNESANLEEIFESTPEGNFIKIAGPDFGFILRYPKGKEDITGFVYEPWHLRYVGVPLARKITEAGVTFDEYL